MKTVDQHIYDEVFNLQAPNVNLFIKEARLAFKSTAGLNFYVSPIDIMIDVDKEPYNEPRMLADDYKELGLWIPSNNMGAPFKAILLAWSDEDYPTPSTFQYVYLSLTNQLVMAKEFVYYNRVKDRSLEAVLTEVIF